MSDHAPYGYSFCEPVSTTLDTWHLRPLTEVGLLFGGGIDTASLCGAFGADLRRSGWDTEGACNAAEIAKLRTQRGPRGEVAVCLRCLAVYDEQEGPMP